MPYNLSIHTCIRIWIIQLEIHPLVYSDKRLGKTSNRIPIHSIGGYVIDDRCSRTIILSLYKWVYNWKVQIGLFNWITSEKKVRVSWWHLTEKKRENWLKCENCPSIRIENYNSLSLRFGSFLYICIILHLQLFIKRVKKIYGKLKFYLMF